MTGQSMKKIKMTKLKFFNLFFFQWFFIRLARIVDEETKATVGYRFIGPIVPLTGWRNDYWWLWKGN